MKSKRNIELTNREYLTGLSMGGTGAWWMAYDDLNNENVFAAIAPVVADGKPEEACKVAERNIPVWAFHGRNDTSPNSYYDAKKTIKGMMVCNPSPEPIFTVYAGVGHNSWDRAYRTDHMYHSPNLYEWLLQQKLNKNGNNLTNEKSEEPNEEKLSASNGLKYEYFEGRWETLPDFSKLISKITGVLDEISFPSEMRSYWSGIKITGSIEIFEAGNYTFYLSSEDGSKLYLDDEVIIDNEGLHLDEEKMNSVFLSSGQHKIQIDYFQKSGSMNLFLEYKGPGFSRKPLSNEILSMPNTCARKLLNLIANEIEDDPFEVVIYPNPVKDILNIHLHDGSNLQRISFDIVDLSGTLLYSEVFYDQKSLTIDLTEKGINSGVYLVILQNEHLKKVVKFIKN